MNHLKDKQYLTPTEAAEHFSLSRNTIYLLVKDGKLPAIKVGGAVRIDMVAFAAQQKETK